MTRNAPGTTDERAALKEEIKRELRKENSRRVLARYGTCLTLLLVAILVPTIYFSALLARTGLVDVPLLADWLYEPSAPTRTVTPLVGSTPQDIAAALAAGADYNPALDAVEIRVTEEELTTLVRAGIRDAVDNGTIPVDVTAPQIVISEDDVEFFAKIPREEREATVLLSFTPYAEAGELRLRPTEFRLGDVEVPRFVAAALLGATSSTVSDAVAQGLGGLGRVTGVELEDGALTIRIQRS